jgi:YidC/Oxa1 family membrane protein insertase
MNDLLLSMMSNLSQLFGGNMGWTILALSLAVRFALLPLTLHLARKMLANQRKIKALQPQADEIKTRLAAQPQQMMSAIAKLYQDNGAKLIDGSSMMGALVQLPVFGLMYKAIDNVAATGGPFLWIRNLGTPDVLLTGLVLALTALSTYYFPSMGGNAQTFVVIVQVAITALFIWKLSAGLGLYWLGSSFVGAIQTLVLRFEQRRAANLPF